METPWLCESESGVDLLSGVAHENSEAITQNLRLTSGSGVHAAFSRVMKQVED